MELAGPPGRPAGCCGGAFGGRARSPALGNDAERRAQGGGAAAAFFALCAAAAGPLLPPLFRLVLRPVPAPVPHWAKSW